MSKCRWCNEDRPFMPDSEGKQHVPLHGGGYQSGTVCHNYNPIPIPKCPECGEQATYQTPDGTYWDSAAHYWRMSP
jgi:hypothetical protein